MNTTVAAGVSAVLYSTTIQIGNSGTPTEYAIKMVSDNYATRVSKLAATTNRATGSGVQTSTEYGVIHTSTDDILTVTLQVKTHLHPMTLLRMIIERL